MSDNSDTNIKYLELFLDKLNTLPLDVQRNFNLMRILDLKSTNVMANVDKKILEQPSSHKRLKLKEIKDLFKLIHSYSDNKIMLINESYNNLNKYIQQLDIHLKTLNEDIENSLTFANRTIYIDDDQMNWGIGVNVKSSVPNANSRNLQKNVFSKIKIDKKEMQKKWLLCNTTKDKLCENLKRKMRINSNACITDNPNNTINKSVDDSKTCFSNNVFRIPFNIPIDPNEPKFCLCRQVAYDDMVACDNSQCEIEWFHFQCIGLTKAPQISWYCPACENK